MSQVIGQVWGEVVGCRNWPVIRVPQFIALRRKVVMLNLFWETIHFYPRPVLAFGYCRCLHLSVCVSVRPSVCVCGKHLMITHHPFKLGSPNLDNRCKRPWLRSPLFLGVIDLDLKGQIDLQSQNLPHFELVHAITHHQLKLQFPNLEQKFILALFRSLPILGLIEIDLQFNF